MHGAIQVFDFDDDNYVMLDQDGMPMDVWPFKDSNQMKLSRVDVVMQGAKVFNHHPVMGAPNSWPRGFPLDLVQDEHTQGMIAFQKDLYANPKKSQEIGVVQYVVDGNPDIGAIHCITKPLPEFFMDQDMSLLVPMHAYSPYNAQATIHTKNAFWAMLLPSTVPGRVSDIWRSYFAQCIFADTGLQLVFSHPKVVQERNEHNYLQDFNAEQDLYNKAGKLVDFLSDWDSENNNIPDRMEALWIDLYEHGYIEVEDVYAVQMWLGALSQVGYQYPPLKRRHRNVAVMGQFNFADRETTVDDVIFWTQKTRERFQSVVAAGPFSEDQIQALQDNSITVQKGDPDAGVVSPLRNLMNVLLSFKNSTKIEGVLYAHDNAILNDTELSLGQYPFETSRIIHNMPHYRTNPGPLSFRAFPDGHVESFKKEPGSLFVNVSEFYEHATVQWGHFVQPYCAPALVNFAKDPHSQQYRDSDGSSLFTGQAQSDFMFVPLEFAELFAEAAELLLQYGIFIEWYVAVSFERMCIFTDLLC